MGVTGRQPAAVVDAGVVAVAAAFGLRLGEGDGAGERRRGSACLPAPRCRSPGGTRSALRSCAARSRRRSARRPARSSTPLPALIAPGGSGIEPVATSSSAILPWIDSTSPSSSVSWSRDLGERRFLPARGVDQLGLAPLQFAAGGDQRLLFGGDRVPRRFDFAFRRRPLLDRQRHPVAQAAHPLRVASSAAWMRSRNSARASTSSRSPSPISTSSSSGLPGS